MWGDEIDRVDRIIILGSIIELLNFIGQKLRAAPRFALFVATVDVGAGALAAAIRSLLPK